MRCSPHAVTSQWGAAPRHWHVRRRRACGVAPVRSMEHGGEKHEREALPMAGARPRPALVKSSVFMCARVRHSLFLVKVWMQVVAC